MLPIQPNTLRLPYIKLRKNNIYGAAALRAVAPYPNGVYNRTRLLTEAFMRSRSQTLFDPGLNPLVAERIRKEYGINDEDFKDMMVSTGKVAGGLYGGVKGAMHGYKAGVAVGGAVAKATTAATTMLIGGQLGPQAALPEELITVPLAFVGTFLGAYFGMQTGAKVGGAVAGTLTPSGLTAASELIRDTLISSVEKQGAKGLAISGGMLLGATAGGWLGGKVGYAGLGSAIGGKIGTSTAIGISDLVTGEDSQEVGAMTGLTMLGNSMDQFSGAAAIKATIIAAQEQTSMQDMINKAYGDHEEGFTQVDFSRIRKNTGVNLGAFGNGIVDFAGELLTDPGVWYSNLEAKASKNFRNEAANTITELQYRGKNKGGGYGVDIGKGENFFQFIGKYSARRIGEIIKESAVSKMKPKTMVGKFSELFTPKIKEFDGFEAFKQEMLLRNSDAAKYILGRFGKNTKAIDNFLKDIYKTIEDTTIRRINDQAIRHSTKMGLGKNKIQNMLDDLESKGLLKNVDLNDATLTELKRQRINYTGHEYNTLVKNYRAFKLSDATDNLAAQSMMRVLNPTMVAFGYGPRRLYRILSKPSTFKSFVKGLKNMAGFNKAADVKETNQGTVFKISQILTENIKARRKEIKDKFFVEPLNKAIEEKATKLNDLYTKLDEAYKQRTEEQKQNYEEFQETKQNAYDEFKEERTQLYEEFRQDQRALYEEKRARTEELIKEYEAEIKEVREEIAKEREAAQMLIFQNGEYVIFDDVLLKIFRDRVTELNQLAKKRPLTESERVELNDKIDALSSHSYFQLTLDLADNLKQEVHTTQFLMKSLNAHFRRMQDIWRFENAHKRFEESRSLVDNFMEKFVANKKEIAQDTLDNLVDLLRKGKRKDFIREYNMTYKNRQGEKQYEEYYKRVFNAQKIVKGYDSISRAEEYARFMDDMKNSKEFQDLLKKYNQWIEESVETIEALIDSDQATNEIVVQLLADISSSPVLHLLDASVQKKVRNFYKKGIELELQKELEQVIENLQKDPEFGKGVSVEMYKAALENMRTGFNDRVYSSFDGILKELGLLPYSEIIKQNTMLMRSKNRFSLADYFSEAMSQDDFFKFLYEGEDTEFSRAIRDFIFANDLDYDDIMSDEFRQGIIGEYTNQSLDSMGYYGNKYSDIITYLDNGDLEFFAKEFYGADLDTLTAKSGAVYEYKLNYEKINVGGEELSILDFLKKFGEEEDVAEFERLEQQGAKDLRGTELGKYWTLSAQVRVLDRVRDSLYRFQLNQSFVRTEMMLKQHNSGLLENILDVLNGTAKGHAGELVAKILEGNAINAKSKGIQEVRTKLEDTIASNKSMMGILERSGLLDRFLDNAYGDKEVLVEGFYSILRQVDKLGLLELDDMGVRVLEESGVRAQLESAHKELYQRYHKYMDHDVLEAIIREVKNEVLNRYADTETKSQLLYAELRRHDVNHVMRIIKNVEDVWKDRLEFEKANEADARQAAQEGLQVEKTQQRKVLEALKQFRETVGIDLRSPYTRAKVANDYLKSQLFSASDIQQKVNWNQLFNINELVFRNSPFVMRQPRSMVNMAKNKRAFNFIFNGHTKLDDLDIEARRKILGETINDTVGPQGEVRGVVGYTTSEIGMLIGALKDYHDAPIDVFEFLRVWKMLFSKGFRSKHARQGLEYFNEVVFPNRDTLKYDGIGLDGYIYLISDATTRNRYTYSFSEEQIKAVYGYYAMLMASPDNIKNVGEFQKAFDNNVKAKREAHANRIEELKEQTGEFISGDINKDMYYILDQVPLSELRQYLLTRFKIKNLNGKLRRLIKHIETRRESGDTKLDFDAEEIRTLQAYIVRNMEGTDGQWKLKAKTNLDLERARVRRELKNENLTARQRANLEERLKKLYDKKYLSRTESRRNWKQRVRMDLVPEYKQGEIWKTKYESRKEAIGTEYENAKENLYNDYQDLKETSYEEYQKTKEQNFEDYKQHKQEIQDRYEETKDKLQQQMEEVHDKFGRLNPHRVLNMQNDSFKKLVQSLLTNPLDFIRFIQAKNIDLGMSAREYVKRFNEFITVDRQDGLLYRYDNRVNLVEEPGKVTKVRRSIISQQVDWQKGTYIDFNGNVRKLTANQMRMDAEIRGGDFRVELNDAIVQKFGEAKYEFSEGTRSEIEKGYDQEVKNSFDNKEAQRRRVLNFENLFSHTLDDLVWYFTKPNGEVDYIKLHEFLEQNGHLRLVAVMKDNAKGSRGYGSYLRDKTGKPILDEQGRPILRKDSFETREQVREQDIQNFLDGKYDIDKPTAKEIMYDDARDLELLVKDLVANGENLRDFTIGVMPIELYKKAKKISFNKYQLPGPLQRYYEGLERVQKFDMLFNSSFHPRNFIDVIRKNSQLVESFGDAIDFMQWGVKTASVYFDLRNLQKNDFEFGTMLYKIKEGEFTPELIKEAEPFINRMLDNREPELRQEIEELRNKKDLEPKDKNRLARLQIEYDSIRDIQLDWMNKKYQEAMVKMYEHHYDRIGFTHYMKLMEMENIRNTVVSKLRKNPKYLLASQEEKARMISETVEDRFNMLNLANQFQKTSAATDQMRYLRALFDGNLGEHPFKHMLESYKNKGIAEGNQKLMHYLAQENPIAKNYMKIGTTIEQIGRLHGFLLDRHLYGTEYNKAISNSLQRHYDYSDRSPLETMATIAVPFIAFPTRNALFWATQFRDAAKFRRWYHFMNAVWGSYDGDEDDEYIQYAKMNGYIPVSNTLIKLGDSRAGAMGMLLNPGQTIYNRLNPFLKAPIETLRGNGSFGENFRDATPILRRIPQVINNYKATKDRSDIKAMLPGIFGTLYSDSDYNSPSFRSRRNIYNELYNFKGNRRQLSTNAYYRVRQIQYQQQARRWR